MDEVEKTTSHLGSVHADVIIGNGELSRLMRELDWSGTALGPVETWTQSLRSAISICLGSRFPIVLYWGPDLVTIYNDGYASILAEKHPWALGRPCAEVWAEIWDVIGPMLKDVIDTGEATWSEDQLLVLDRHDYPEECYFSFSFSPVRGEGNAVDGVFTAVIENTERVIGERRLQTLRDLGARTAACGSDAEACSKAIAVLAQNDADIPFALVYLFDPSGGHAQLAGAVGLPPGTLASPESLSLRADEREPQAWPITRVARSHRAEFVDYLEDRFGNLPGGCWPEPATSALVLPIEQAGQDEAAGVLVVGISPRRALDESYRGFFELVAGHIATALGDARAHEAERRRAEALAELDRAKTTFFSNVSHEFRTPLTLLLGPLHDTLAAPPDTLRNDHRERLEIARRNALRLLKLVNSLLDFARIEAGRVDAIYEPTDLSTLTANLASVFRSAIERAGLSFVIDCGPQPAVAYVDHDMWEKIVLNLLSNALKFTQAGEIAVSLGWHDETVELKVRDTGVGLSQLELPHIFERFRQVRSSWSRTQEGTGIGLALVQELVRLHGGTISVTSEVGRGTTFTVEIPTGTKHLPADRISVDRTRASTAIGAEPFLQEALRWIPEEYSHSALVPWIGEEVNLSLDPPLGTSDDAMSGDHSVTPLPSEGVARVLIVDDNADMRRYLAGMLGQHWRVQVASDGVSGLQAARRHCPDLILSDVMMPGFDGFSLVRALREDPLTESIPVILLSARAGDEPIVEGLEAGADDYIVKPFGARELVARVGTHLALARSRRLVEVSHRRMAFLAEVSKVLASSIEYVTTLSHVAQLAVPLLADVCIIDILDEANQLNRIAVAAADPVPESVVQALRAATCDVVGNDPMARALSTGEPIRVSSKASPETGGDRCASEEVAEFLNAHPIISRLIVPLVSRERTLGAITLLANSSRAPFSLDDQTVAVDLAQRCSLAIDNGRLYKDAREQAAIQITLNTELRKAAVVRDRALAEADAERSRLRSVFLDAPAFLAILRGPGHVFDFVNPPYVQVVGRRSEEELVGKPVRVALPEVEGQGFVDLLDRVYATGIPFVGTEMWLWLARRPSGELEDICVNFVYQPLRGSDGEIDGICAIGFEVTEQVRARQRIEILAAENARLAEQAQREAQARAAERDWLRQVVDSLPEGIAIADARGRIVIRNEAAARLSGLSTTDSVETSNNDTLEIRQFDGSPILEEDLPLMRSLRRGETIRGYQLLVHHLSDGRDTPLLISSAPLRDEKSQIAGAVAVFQDISAIKKFERQKDEFLSSVSHDLKTPLTAIKGHTQLLYRELERTGTLRSDRALRALKTIDATVATMANIVGDLLDVTRMSMDRPLDLARRPTDLVVLINGLLGGREHLTRYHTVRLECIASSLVGNWDSIRLERALGNLLDNAVKYTPPGRNISLRVDIENQRNGGEAIVIVQDEGIGIPKADLPFIFERFRRASNVEGRIDGSGLGLASVRQVVEQHGGTIRVESAEGRGSTFTVRLPMGESV